MAQSATNPLPPIPSKQPPIFDKPFDIPGSTFISQQPTPPPDKPWSSYIFETVGKGLIDSEVLDPEVSWPSPEVSSRFATIGQKVPHLQIGHIPGINTDWDKAVDHANYVGQFTRGYSVEGVHNCSHSPMIDLAEVFTLNYGGISPNTAQLLQENWIAFHQANASRPYAKYLQICHSQGALHVRNALARAPKEIKDRVIVVAIAPAAIVTDDLCFRPIHLACKGDVVPYGELSFLSFCDDPDRIGCPRLLEEGILNRKNDLILLEQHPDATGGMHDFQGLSFQKTLKDIIENYIDHQGEYR